MLRFLLLNLKLRMIFLDEQTKKRKFEELFIQNFPKIKAFAYKLLQAEEDAEDIAQDVFVKLWDTDEVWGEVDSLDTYLYAMTRNRIYNFLKHKQVEDNYKEKLGNGKTESTEQEFYDVLYAKELQILVKLALDQMPAQRRRVFEMSRYANMSNQEIADRLQLSVRTVERHIYLALQDLKKIIIVAIFFKFWLSSPL